MTASTKERKTRRGGKRPTPRTATAVEAVPVTWPREGLARVDEAALFFRCSRSAIYKMIREGLVDTVPVGRDRRITWPSIWNYCETRGRTGSTT